MLCMAFRGCGFFPNLVREDARRASPSLVICDIKLPFGRLNFHRDLFGP